MSQIKAIIFDCDGTLVDSEDAHFAAWRRVLQDIGRDLTGEEYKFFSGKPDITVAGLLTKQIPGVKQEDLSNQKKTYFLEHINEKGLPPIHGTIEFLHRLSKEKDKLGLKTAVASAARKHEILLSLKRVEIENSFDLIVSGQEDLKDYRDPEGVNKPKPYIYLQTAKLLGLSPAECIAIEDSHTGVVSAASAGCVTIAIPHCYSKSQDLSNASLILENLSKFSVDEFLEMAISATKCMC